MSPWNLKFSVCLRSGSVCANTSVRFSVAFGSFAKLVENGNSANTKIVYFFNPISKSVPYLSAHCLPTPQRPTRCQSQSRLLCARLFEKFINLSAFIPSLRIRSNYFGFILISIFLMLRHKAQHSCNFFRSSKNMSSSLLRIVLVQPFSTASDNNDCHLLRAN